MRWGISAVPLEPTKEVTVVLSSFRPARTLLLLVAGLALLGTVLFFSWPAGVVLGLTGGVAAVIMIGHAMARQAAAEPHDGHLDLTPSVEVALRDDVRRLRRSLGDDYADFVRAAVLVVGSQWASVAALQRGLGIQQDRARRLLSALEDEGFVGALTGTHARDVLIAQEDVPQLERLLVR